MNNNIEFMYRQVIKKPEFNWQRYTEMYALKQYLGGNPYMHRTKPTPTAQAKAFAPILAYWGFFRGSRTAAYIK